VKKEATATKRPAAPLAPQQRKDAERKALVATIRWAQVLPVDFDGVDTSLTQAQLAVLK
jgi:hypothetical protein